MADGRVPVRESVGAALRFVRETWQPIAVVSAIGAVVLTILSVLSTTVPALSLPVTIATTFANAFVYAAFISACLAGAPGLAQRIGGDGMRVWGAMAVVGFFLLIVFVVLGIPGIIVFAVMVAGRYATELQAVQGDEAQMATLIQRIFTENPGILLGFLIFYGALWFALTSRLYLAAPASVDAKRILSFETWAWTKNNMLRILGARLLADTGEWGTYAWNEHLLGAPGYRIAGGSDEIQRNIVGERVLGLPPEPRVDKDLPFSEALRAQRA